MTSSSIDASIIVPAYNCAVWLLLTLLDSLLGQRGVECEIIAVCDGATDHSLAVLEAAAQRDARIRVVAQENRGVSATRNAGIALARGEWIVFADGDDWLAPDAVRTWIDHGRRHELDVVVGNGFGSTTTPHDAPPTPLYANQRWDRNLRWQKLDDAHRAQRRLGRLRVAAMRAARIRRTASFAFRGKRGV